MEVPQNRNWRPEDERSYLALRDRAASELADLLSPVLAPLWASVDPDPQQLAQRDAGHHLDALHDELVHRGARDWLEYVSWLQQLLAECGAPPSLLPESLTVIGQVLTSRLSPSTQASVNATLRATVLMLRTDKTGPYYYGGVGPKPWAGCEALRKALVEGDRPRCEALFNASLDASGDPIATAVHLLQPALYNIGHQWEHQTLTVDQEHLATSIVERLLDEVSPPPDASPADEGRILLARVPHNQHALGLRIVADAFRRAGWQVRLLAQPAGANELLPLLRAWQPQMLGLTASLPSHLIRLRELVGALRTELGNDLPPVVVGGLAVNQYPGVAARMGVTVVGPDAEQIPALLPVQVNKTPGPPCPGATLSPPRQAALERSAYSGGGRSGTTGTASPSRAPGTGRSAGRPNGSSKPSPSR